MTSSRRANREGSVYKRADGLWAGAVSLDGGRRRVVYARTKAEASRKVSQLLRDLETGVPITVGPRLTVAAFLGEMAG
ncbi:MAG: hypothetical protein ACYDAY_02105 [Candidatus Dormibacteria bacterium]